MIHTAEEIAASLADEWDAFAQIVANMDDTAFVSAPEGKWTPGQHMDHLIKSAVPVRKALAYPKFVFRLLFGKPNRPGRAFDTLNARYLQKLSEGGAASGRFVPPPIPRSEKAKTMAAYTAEKDRIVRATLRWSEAALDNYLMPHPLLGKITVREMMFFTSFHTRHHLELVRAYPAVS